MHRDEDLAGGSESWHDISCTICESDDRHVEAAAHCKECRMWLCDRCLKLHNRFPAIRNHHIESVNRSANGNGETAAIIRGPSNFKFVYHASVHFSTDVKNREISRNDNASNLKSRFEIHEQRARAIEACRKRADQKEELTLQALLLLPLDISAAPQSTDLLPVYRTGEVQLTLKGEKGLFKYGSGVYDLEKFNQIVTPRIAEFRKYSTTINLHEGIGHFYSTPRPNYGYVIYSARDSGVTKHDLEKVLNACHVADVKDRERHYVLRQMRDEIYDLLNGDEGYAINVHFRKLLLRWLANIPKHLNEQTICGGDLNDVPFPIPDDIRRDVSVLRDWEYSYVFKNREDWNDDVTVPASGAWKRIDDDDDDYYDDNDDNVHESFVTLCAKHHERTNKPNFDTGVDGDVAWKETECDVIKNDVTTAKQELTLAKRAERGQVTEKAMVKARKRLRNFLCRNCPNKKTLYIQHCETFVANLKESWQCFQLLHYSS
ncbi:uncharacterized protein LOC128207492 [Mya arenaria]|uniref:uncharacterized protein LOC128207492 n=1 Tax=Mya arenaria TaxID=6604 RepID=UPI0022E80FB4|nr:uncharacterized protein LOC128207492 [Mya arenaria]